MSDWMFEDSVMTEIPEDALGFVYMIRHVPSGRGYIGKKLFFFKSQRQVKGKKKSVLVESDWRKYYSSSDELKALVKTDGEEAFTRTVLHICYTKGMMSYLEAKEQFIRGVLEDGENWINGQIQCRVHHSHIKWGPPVEKTPKKSQADSSAAKSPSKSSASPKVKAKSCTA